MANDSLGPIMHKGKSVGGVTVDVTDKVTKGDMRPVTSNAVASMNNYSLEEQVIGTWIDGKPIYRKVIVDNNVLSVGISKIGMIENHSTIISIYGTVKSSLGHITELVYSYPSNEHAINIDQDGSIIMYHHAENYNAQTIVVVEYTKTTDAPTI